MLRPPFAGHRRYSITHRAVQRLRELVLAREDEDDEMLRDRLDEALCQAEDSGKAIQTLDAKLGEPQTLIPIDSFGEKLFAIIKEDTVVTVLPEGHGEEILQRGQAMEERVAAGSTRTSREEPERPEHRRKWRKDAPGPVVIERIVRGAAPGGGVVSRIESVGSMAPDESGTASEAGETTDAADDADLPAKVVPMPERETKPDGPVAIALHRALAVGRRRAAVAALRETLSVQFREASILPLWNELAEEGIPRVLTVGDLIEAARGLD